MSIDLKELQDSARQVVDGSGIAATEQESWTQLVELGWPLVAVPEDLGGLGLGLAGACILHAELGRGLTRAPFLPATMVIDAVCRSQLPEREDWLERLTTGEYLAAPLCEPSVSLEGDSLTGRASAVQSADTASHVLVWTESGDCVALVSMEQAGVVAEERAMWDTTRRLFDVRLDNVPLDEQLVLARGEQAQRLVIRLGAARDFGLAADAAGGADALLIRTVEHLTDRRQFGRPLAMFQALKHRCADLKAGVEAAQALLFSGLGEADTDTADELAVETDAEMAKYLACSGFARVAEESLQLHGGIGMAAEHPCHLFLKRAMLSDKLGRTGGQYELDIAASVVTGAA